ncbi:hypothetical protein MAPG_05900 [Magnaporthiopsis poae ATCC 64411]|uniref:Uncharacterized protein n=1 Tax=Magnaporthiopsis poae (strain ATCC 64411 / 73-15) TaxID=644358 RepID=A0A0C4E0L9_MAGP6|nr:hypothetical protein MAPG_05900 [Magnaporthiopsis poae ATCC 64411]
MAPGPNTMGQTRRFGHYPTPFFRLLPFPTKRQHSLACKRKRLAGGAAGKQGRHPSHGWRQCCASRAGWTHRDMCGHNLAKNFPVAVHSPGITATNPPRRLLFPSVRNKDATIGSSEKPVRKSGPLDLGRHATQTPQPASRPIGAIRAAGQQGAAGGGVLPQTDSQQRRRPTEKIPSSSARATVTQQQQQPAAHLRPGQPEPEQNQDFISVVVAFFDPSRFPRVRPEHKAEMANSCLLHPMKHPPIALPLRVALSVYPPSHPSLPSPTQTKQKLGGKHLNATRGAKGRDTTPPSSHAASPACPRPGPVPSLCTKASAGLSRGEGSCNVGDHTGKRRWPCRAPASIQFRNGWRRDVSGEGFAR